jgi:hypothetical protein
MTRWTTKKLPLKEGHGWKAKPGYSIFVADRGAVRFDVPRNWVAVPQSRSFQFYDRPQPDDDCRLEVSVLYLPPGIDFSDLPVDKALAEVMADQFRDAIARGEIVRARRPDLELAWVEARYIDPVQLREACTRTCVARRGVIQPLITMDFWASDAERFIPVWDEVIRSLQLGVYVKDPTHRRLD